MLHVKPDTVWEDTPWRIRYRNITELTFGDRYLTVFGKYAGELNHEEEHTDAPGVGQA